MITPNRIIILTAVDLERKAVLRAVKNSGQQNINVACIGIKGVHIESALQVVFSDVNRQDVRPVVMILAGFAGALSPTLNIGDVVSDSPLADAHHGQIVTSATLLSTSLQKKELFEKTGAIAVDMEGDIVREAVKHRASRFIHVRAISDSCHDELDPRIMGIVNEYGQVRPIRLIATLLRHPSLLPKLIRLGRHANLASKKLTHAIEIQLKSI